MKKQQGAVLIVSLVILLVTTILGVAAMQGTSLEMKMAKNVEQRQKVFHAAEAALRKIENSLETRAYTENDLDSSLCASGSANCFESTCAGGLCFFGDSSATDQVNCEIYTGTPPSYPVWHKTNALQVWTDGAKHATLADIDKTTFKYVVEFQCYVDSTGGVVGTAASPVNLGDALYRITLLANNPNGNINIMLQSTYGMPAL